NERKYSVKLVCFFFLLFFLGVLLNYFVIFPFSFRFLGTYQVSENVVNQISLSSYVSTFLMLSLLMGILFEIPVVSFFMAKLGLINAQMLREYHRHAIVVICVISAIITPTADIFTLLLVAMPIFLLYELSIVIVKRVETRKK
ncbi:MAG: twin-arginine translocase subunit TatC, partial [Bacteroidales bacterium]|nr:twin-arginine translocase subunit TatC [Bacteroidales bacterium]